MADFTSQIIRKAGTWTGAFAQCVLTYEERFLRRKVIKTAQGKTLLVDLAHTVSLDHGDAFELPDLSLIEVTAAEEPYCKSPEIWYNWLGTLEIAIRPARLSRTAF